MPDKEFSLPEVSSLDEVPEDYRAFYYEKDGKVQRQNPASLAGQLAKSRRESEQKDAELLQTKNALAIYQEALGDEADPETIRLLKDKAARADASPTEADVQKRLDTLRADYEKKMKAQSAEMQKLDSIVRNNTVADRLREALREANASDDGVALLPERMLNRVSVDYADNGKITIRVLDEDGTGMYVNGQEASLVDLATELKTKHPSLFKGSGATGMGSGANATSVPSNVKSWSKMTDAEKIAFQKQHGRAAVNAMIARDL